LAELDNPDGAVSLWNEIVNKQAASPFAEQALAAVANTQLKAGRLSEALKSYEQYLALYPTGEGNRNALCGLAECRLRDKKPDGAREAYLKALGAKGTDAELDDIGERAILGLAQLALDANKAEESKKLALRIVIDKPESKSLDQALLLCAKASEEMKEPAQAIGYYRKLLTDRPKSDCVAAARERLQALGAPAETGKKD
jgi:tetratricopeptide (TPR) repeat protein